MAACLSPSPSGRRLSELLEEQQEPFVLDLHLLEKGCSSRLLDDGYDTALCWPAPGGNDAAAAVLKRLTSKKQQAVGKNVKKQQPARAGILKILISKVLRGKQQAGRKKPAALQFSESFKVVAGSKPAAVAPAPCGDEIVSRKQEAERCNYDSDCYDSGEEDEKQLSPVSVLDHPFESSPVHTKLSPSKNNAIDIFRDLLDSALLTQLLSNQCADDLATEYTTSSSSSSAADEDKYCYGGYPKSGGRRRQDEAAYWEAHRAELARVAELVASEVPSARLDHSTVVPEREGVGATVADAVFNALLHELVADLLGAC